MGEPTTEKGQTIGKGQVPQHKPLDQRLSDLSRIMSDMEAQTATLELAVARLSGRETEEESMDCGDPIDLGEAGSPFLDRLDTAEQRLGANRRRLANIASALDDLV